MRKKWPKALQKITKKVRPPGRFNFSKAELLLFVAVFACIGGLVLLRSDAAGSTANVFISTSGSDTGSNCVRFATPVANPTATTVCATMAKAISLAQPGDIIQLEPGSYGSLTISRQTGEDSPKVVIRGDPNLTDQQKCVESQAKFLSASPLCAHGNVLISGMTVCGHGLSIQNFDTTGLSTTFYVGYGTGCPTGSGNMVADNHDIDIINSHFTYQSTLTGHDLLVSHTRIGPNESICDPSHNLEDGDNLHIWPESHTTPWTVPYDITLDHNLIYDARLGNGSGGIAAHGCGWGAHTDLVQTLGYSNLTVTDNILWGAVDAVWQDGAINGSVMSGNNTFENNFFGPSGIDGGLGNNGFGSGDSACSSAIYTFRNNTNMGNFRLDCPGAEANHTFYGNYLGYVSADKSYTCGAGTYDYNVFGTGTNVTCGTHTKTCSPTFQYTPADNSTEANFTHGWDLHVASSDTCLKGAGNPTNFTSTDFDGDSRGSPPYAGADEYAAPAGTANLWIDTDGGTCTRSALPTAYSNSSACASLNAALVAASSGDLVLMKCGTYPAQTINTVKTSGNVTFRSETDKCAVLEGNGSGAVTFANKVGYLTLDHFTINGQILSSTATGTGNNNITITNNDIDVGKKVDGPPVNYSVGSNLTISHNTIGPSCCGYNGGSGWSPEGIRIGKPSTEAATCQTEACNVTIADNLIQYAVRDCQYWPSSGFGACPDTTCTNAVGCHMDGIHVWGMDGGTITGNRLYGVECQGIYFENTNNSLQRNINITNNAVSSVTGGCSNKGIYFSAGGSTNNVDTGFAGTWNIAFNSGTSYIMGPGGCSSCQTGTVFNIVGNDMMLDVVNSSGNNAGCGAAAWGVATVNFSYNVWRPGGGGSTNAACGATDTLTSTPPAFVNEVSPPATGIDLHLASASTVANDFVPSGVCGTYVSVDFDGNTRPQGAACDAGADEFISGTGGGSVQGDLNADGHINITDLSILLSHYGQSVSASLGDINSDGTCNITDLSILLSHYGT